MKSRKSPSSKASAERTVNVTPTSAGKGLKEDLQLIAQTHGLKIGPLVAMIYAYSLEYTTKFQEGLKKTRQKDGSHIGSRVPPKVADGLTTWAKTRKTSRGHQCCFILEKALEAEMIPDIMKWYGKINQSPAEASTSEKK